MAQLPTKIALGTVMPTASRPIAVADTTAVGKGIAQMGAGLQAVGTDIDYMAKKQAREATLVETSGADANSVKEIEALRQGVASDGDYATQQKRFDEGSNVIIQKWAGGISDPRARQIWTLDSQKRLVGSSSALAAGAITNAHQTRGVLYEDNIKKLASVVADPATDEATRKQAQANIQSYIDIGQKEGILTPEGAQQWRVTYDQGSIAQLASARGRTKNGNAAVTAPPAAVPGDTFSRMLVAENAPGDPGTVSPKGALGLAQVMPGTAREMLRERGLTAEAQMSDAQLHAYFVANPEMNKAIGRAYFDKQMKAFGGDADAAVVAYNAGPGVAASWLKANKDPRVLPAETRDYLAKVQGGGASGAEAQVGQDVGIGPEETPDGQPVKAPFVNAQGKAYDTTITVKPGEDMSRLSPGAQGMVSGILKDGVVPELRINAAFETGGHAKASQHYHGNAIDIQVSGLSDQQKAALVASAIKNGAKGIGIYPSGRMIHIDTRQSPTFWGPNPAGMNKGASLDMAPAWAKPALGTLFKGGGGTAPAPDPYATTYQNIRTQYPSLAPNQVNALVNEALSARHAFDVEDRAALALGEQQRKMQVDQLQYGARNGQIADGNIEDAWHSGQFKTYEEYSSVRAARKQYLDDRDNGAGAVDQIFGDGSTTRFNPFDADSKKIATNAYNELVRAAPDQAIAAVDAIQKRTGIVPQPAANGLRAAIYGADPATGGQAMQIAANLMTRNPNAFAGVDGGDQIAKSAVAYRHFLEQGATTEDATRRVMQMNDPAYRSKVNVKDDDLKKFSEGITPATIGKTFDTNSAWLPFGDPRVGVSPEQQGAITQDFREVAEQFYKESGDANLAMAQAKAQLSRVYGVSAPFGQATVTKYPPERSYPPVKEAEGGDDHAYIYRQAVEAVKEATGKDIPVADIALLPLPHDTAQAFDGGKPAPYRLAYVDRSSGQPALQYIYGPSGRAAFVADPVEAQAAVDSGQAAAFRRQQEIAPPNGAPMATKDPGRYTAAMAPKELSDGQGAMLPTSDADRKQWADEQNARLDARKQSIPNIPPVSADTRAYAYGPGPDYADTPAAPPAPTRALAVAPAIPAAAAPSGPALPPPTQDEAAATTQRKRQIQVDERRKKAGLPPFYQSDIPS